MSLVSLPVSERFDALIDNAGSYKLGLLGGTFDPIHIGHLNIAQRALEQYSLDGVLFITTGAPTRKVENGFLDAEHRHAMVKAAVSSNSKFDASRIEIDREGETFTIDTLRALKARFGNHVDLYFIAGFDAASDMKTWNGADEIAELVTVLCAKRRTDENELAQSLEAHFSDQTLFSVKQVDTINLDISSQALRALLKEGCSAKYLIPDDALDYIKEHGLYR